MSKTLLQTVARGDDALLVFTYDHQPRWLELERPLGREYVAEVIDPWEMTIDASEQRYSGQASIPLPVKPAMVVRLRALES